MIQSQLNLKDLTKLLKRRWKLLIIPPIIVTVICIIGAYRITRMYESSTRLFIQQNQISNPFTNLMMQTDEGPLYGVKELLGSSRTIEQLIDSLGLNSSIQDEIGRRQVIQKIRNDITITIKGNESISISFMNSDPFRAQHGVIALMNIFIDSKTNTKNNQNESMVDFYEKKVFEFQKKFEESQNKILPKITARIRDGGSKNLSINSVDQQIGELEKKEKDLNDEIKIIDKFQEKDIETKEGKEILYELLRADVPYASDLRILFSQYSELSERYTGKNPILEKIAIQVFDLLGRIKTTLINENEKINKQLSQFKNQRMEIINEMVRLSMREQVEKSEQQDYSLYQRMYAEMKVKLEEAEMTQSLAKENNFKIIILEPAFLPLFPSKPSRISIIFGGFGAGILVGIILTIVSELLDTTIRSSKQMQLYGKPIIALLPSSVTKHKI